MPRGGWVQIEMPCYMFRMPWSEMSWSGMPRSGMLGDRVPQKPCIGRNASNIHCVSWIFPWRLVANRDAPTMYLGGLCYVSRMTMTTESHGSSVWISKVTSMGQTMDRLYREMGVDPIEMIKDLITSHSMNCKRCWHEPPYAHVIHIACHVYFINKCIVDSF